jgi:hypothetical protein
MNAVPGVPGLDASARLVDVQAAWLVEHVRAKAHEARATLEWDADAQVDAILRAARAEAHARIRAAARAKRERVAERCRKAAAEAETRDRTSEFAIARQFVARALETLPAALGERWRDPEARVRWCTAAIQLASRRLVARNWRIEVDAQLDPAERDVLATCVAAAGARVAWVDADGVGLRIDGGGVTVDATVPGLLADRAGVESLLLAALDEARATAAGEAR